MYYYEVYVTGPKDFSGEENYPDGYSAFFESDKCFSANPKAGLVGDDIIAEAIEQGKMDADDRRYVEYAKKISAVEYRRATYSPMQHVQDVRKKYKDGMSFVEPISEAICGVDSTWSLQLSQLLLEFAQAAAKDASAHVQKTSDDLAEFTG